MPFPVLQHQLSPCNQITGPTDGAQEGSIRRSGLNLTHSGLLCSTWTALPASPGAPVTTSSAAGQRPLFVFAVPVSPTLHGLHTDNDFKDPATRLQTSLGPPYLDGLQALRVFLLKTLSKLIPFTPEVPFSCPSRSPVSWLDAVFSPPPCSRSPHIQTNALGADGPPRPLASTHRSPNVSLDNQH